MSRTYRRTKDPVPKWALRDYSYSTSYFLRIQIDPKSKEGKEKIARYKSDAMVTMNGSPPKWFRRQVCHKPFREKERQALHLVKKGELETLFPKLLSDANWKWW